MEVTSPGSLWREFAAAALPFNLSELSEKTVDGVTVKEYYFDGFATLDGRVRAFMRIHEKTDHKGVILYLSDTANESDNHAIKFFNDSGYTVAMLDLLGKSNEITRFTIYPRSLASCNSRNASSFDAPDDVLTSCWYVWMCLARKATLLIKSKYENTNIYALGKGIGGSTVYKLCAFNDGITACATILNIIPNVNGTGNPMIYYRAALDNYAYAPLTETPLFMAVASNDEDGSFDAMSLLADKTESLDCFRIVERSFSSGINIVYPQIVDFFENTTSDNANLPELKIKATNSDNNLYFNIGIDGDDEALAEYKNVSLLAAFCIENPKLRNWTNLPLVSLGGKEFLARADVHMNTAPVYAFVNISNDSGDVISSKLISLIPKSLGIPSQPAVKRHLIYEGSMGKDVWSSPNGGSVNTKSGLFDIDGVYSDAHSLATFKPGDMMYRADEGVLLQIMVSGKPQKITISVYDDKNEYTFDVNIPNYDKWYKFTLSQTDFKNKGGQLSSWSKINMIKFTSSEEFLISSVLWV